MAGLQKSINKMKHEMKEKIIAFAMKTGVGGGVGIEEQQHARNKCVTQKEAELAQKIPFDPNLVEKSQSPDLIEMKPQNYNMSDTVINSDINSDGIDKYDNNIIKDADLVTMNSHTINELLDEIESENKNIG